MPLKPTVEWGPDDFLGGVLDARYNWTTAGTGVVDLAGDSHERGGAVRLHTTGAGFGAARLRLGREARENNGLSILNWHANRAVKLEARVKWNSQNDIQSTVGFIGENDPDIGLAMYRTPGAASGHPNPNTWAFQSFNVPVSPPGVINASMGGWQHTPGQYHFIEIETGWTPIKFARLKIDGIERAYVYGDLVPEKGLGLELQIWNEEISPGVWSQVAIWCDLVYLVQQR